MNCRLPKMWELSLVICLFGYLKTGACDSPDPENSVFHPIISYDIKVISHNSTIRDFVSTFVKQVYDSDTLTDLFDITAATSTGLRNHAYNDFIKIINQNNLDDAELIADFATRPINQNFDTIPRDVLVRIYANIAANFLYSIGKFSSKNDAESLAKQYAKDFSDAAEKFVKDGDVETKYDAIAGGIINFIVPIQKVTQDEVWKVAFLFESQFLLAAVELGYTNDAYDQCAKAANESM
ncbi:uncharacterized protein NPIL_581251 [Nephila pilipes]|uniref:Uncharacterized protein n=1 Tax=Nephila pilipes TaxID=299642 RepID=A0A8X6TC68_NEPPI|nr:uncharacterized protein NPIL_581251 [Nephila pilipes]